MENYIKGKGILAGEFTQEDLSNGADEKVVKKIMSDTGLTDIRVDFITEGTMITKAKVYVCTEEDRNSIVPEPMKSELEEDGELNG